MGVSFPGEIDFHGRVAKSCDMFPGWCDVPLADWLELRLSRRVTLINSEKCLNICESSQFTIEGCDDDLLCSLGASYLALERFQGFVHNLD